MQHGTNALTCMEQFEGFINLLKRHVVGNKVVDIQLTIHIALDVTR